MKPDIKIINIFCDAECEHISSSSLKEIEKFTKWLYENNKNTPLKDMDMILVAVKKLVNP